MYSPPMRPSPSELLHAARTPAFLVTDPANIRYLTGYPADHACLLALPRRWLLFVSSLEILSAERGATSNVAVRDIAELPEQLRGMRRCGYEAETVTVERLVRWRRMMPKIRFAETKGVLQEFRRSKEPDELRNLRQAQRMTKEILRRIPSMLRKSITEEKLARQILLWSLELGGDGLSFDPIVAFGTHTACPHHRPTSRLLQKGHIVQIDIGVKCKGYCADMSEVFFTVKPTKIEEQVYRALCLAQRKAMKAVRPGASTRALDRIAREVLTKAGIEKYFTHSLGHGVGLEIHEGVSLSAKAADRKLLRNEVVTIEPGVYIPGKFGMRVEDMVYVQ